MEFLKEILGNELFAQFETAVNAFNGKPENKDKQIKLADLGKGEYVSKSKYADLETDKGSISEQLKTAQGLIEELKNGTGKDDTLQGKITEYEGAVATLKAENLKLKTESALKVALLDAGAKPSDMDYLLYKASQNGEIKINEDGKLKGQEDLISGLKTQCPSQFATSEQKKVQEHKLDDGDGNNSITKSDLLKKSYLERAKFAEENAELYSKIMND